MLPRGLRLAQLSLLQKLPCFAVDLIGDYIVVMVVMGYDCKLDGKTMRLEFLFCSGYLLDRKE